MKPSALLAVVVVAALSGACRQPDGPTPILDEQSSQRIVDLSHDLGAIANGDVDGRRDFADDLLVLVDSQAAGVQAVVQGFAGRFADAVAPAKLTEQSAQQLAHTSWILVSATEMSERQVRALQTQLRAQLGSVGIGQDRVDAVVAEVPTVQRAISTRPRRWYEVL